MMSYIYVVLEVKVGNLTINYCANKMWVFPQ
jgi:hypothetical protein